MNFLHNILRLFRLPEWLNSVLCKGFIWFLLWKLNKGFGLALYALYACPRWTDEQNYFQAACKLKNMMKKQNITILGATGSIGQSTLNIVARHPDKFSVFALTAYSQVQKLADLCVQFSPQYAVINGEENADKLNKLLKSKGDRKSVV